MLPGVLLLAFAFAILVGTIVVVVRLEATETATWWERFWRIYNGWMGTPDPQTPWARYCLLFTVATSTLYGLAFFAAQSASIGLVSAFLVARVSTVFGAFLAWPGMGYGIGASMGAITDRSVLRFLALFPVFLLSFVLLFLHPFGFAGAWLPVEVWLG
jgi:hypothetical protein